MGKLSNDEIYQSLMDLRKNNPKRYACLRIAEIYGQLKKRLFERKSFEEGIKTSAKFRPITDEEVAEMMQRIKEITMRMVKIYGLTQKDLDHYNTYAVGTLKITIA